MIYIVSLSGGNNSLNCLKYCIEKFGKESVVAIFADNHFEHPSLYEGLKGTEEFFGINIVRVQSDRFKNPVDVNKSRHLIGHDKVRCTEETKIIPIKKGIKEHFPNKEEYVMVIGYNKEETKRMEKARAFQAKAQEYELFFPAEHDDGRPISYVDFRDIYGFPPQGVYDHGGRSNNCGGGCFKMSNQSGYILGKNNPEEFMKGEGYEQEIHDEIMRFREVTYTKEQRDNFKTQAEHMWLDHKRSLREKRLEGETGFVPKFKKRRDGSVLGKCQQGGIECGFTV